MWIRLTVAISPLNSLTGLGQLATCDFVGLSTWAEELCKATRKWHEVALILCRADSKHRSMSLEVATVRISSP
jgi:hypothetical protein